MSTLNMSLMREIEQSVRQVLDRYGIGTVIGPTKTVVNSFWVAAAEVELGELVLRWGIEKDMGNNYTIGVRHTDERDSFVDIGTTDGLDWCCTCKLTRTPQAFFFFTNLEGERMKMDELLVDIGDRKPAMALIERLVQAFVNRTNGNNA